MIKATALIAFLAIAPQICGAADWQAIGVTSGLSPTKATVYGNMFLDNDSVVMTGSNYKAWIRTIYNSDIVNDKKGRRHREDKALWVVDCKERTLGIAMVIVQTAAGHPSVEFSVDPILADLVDAVPDSIGEQMLKAICKVAATLNAPELPVSTPATQPAVYSAATPVITLQLPNCGEDYYPSQALRFGQAGAAIVRVCVGTNNKIDGPIELITSSGFPSLDEAAGKCMAAGRFKAGTAEGKPTQACKDYKVTFGSRSIAPP